MSALLTYGDVAEKLQLSVRTIQEMKEDGTLKGFKVGKRAVRFHPEDIDAYIKQIRDEQCPSTSEAASGTTTSRSTKSATAAQQSKPRKRKPARSKSENVIEYPWEATLAGSR